MNPKASATLEKVREDRRRSNFKKALSRLEEAIGKFPGELTLYTEAIDIGMEAGESLKAIHVLKKSQRQLPDDAFELWTFAAEKVGAYNDPIVGRFMLEQGIRNGDLTGAYAILQSLSDHAAGEVLQHITTKKQAMSHAMGATLSAPGDVVSYTLGEALLHLRLGSLTEAMEGFVRALDEDSGVFKPLEPFLADLEKQHGDKGGASYALGYCHIAAGRTAKGVEALARAARRAPDLVPRVIETIESLDDGPDLPPQARDLKLAELYLEKGDTHRSCELFSSLLGRDIAMAGIIADALRTAVETIGDNLDAPFLFVEASITAGRREAALSLLRKIHRCRAHRSTLVEWLESKSRSERLSADVQFFFAETALSEGLYGKAIEIFKQMLSHPHGTEEQGAIKEILSKYQSVLLVQHFYTERFGASSMREREAMCEFERYDGNSFAASKAEKSPCQITDEKPTIPEEALGAKTAPTGRDTADPGTAIPVRPRTEGAIPPDFDNRDFSLSMHARRERSIDESTGEDSRPPSLPAADFSSSSEEVAGSDLFEYLNRDFAANTETAPDGDERTEECAAGAPEEEVEEKTDTNPQWTPEETAEEATVETEPEDEQNVAAEIPDDFDSLYRAFLDGSLDRGRTIEVVERAFDEDRMDEMKRLLAFEPATLGEEIARKYQLARYYLAMERPVSALVALRTVQLGALSKEENKTFLLRIAECYRRLHNFQAAHGIYLRVLSEFPGDPTAEAAARTNYAMYIESAAGAALTLEKLTNL